MWRWGEKTASVVAFASLNMCGVHTLGSTLMPYLKYIKNLLCCFLKKKKNCLLLVDVLQEEPQSAHGEQEECPVDHSLVVLESRSAGYERVSRAVDRFVGLRLPDLGVLRHNVLRSGGGICSP